MRLNIYIPDDEAPQFEQFRKRLAQRGLSVSQFFRDMVSEARGRRPPNPRYQTR